MLSTEEIAIFSIEWIAFIMLSTEDSNSLFLVDFIILSTEGSNPTCLVDGLYHAID